MKSAAFEKGISGALVFRVFAPQEWQRSLRRASQSCSDSIGIPKCHLLAMYSHAKPWFLRDVLARVYYGWLVGLVISWFRTSRMVDKLARVEEDEHKTSGVGLVWEAPGKVGTSTTKVTEP
eukprot:5235036-Amphidinium_carterae.1